MNEWSTANVSPPPKLIDQVLGQDRAAHVIRLAARQRRFVLLIGDPGTGKSMLGRSMADLMEFRPDQPVVVVPNRDHPIAPLVQKISHEDLVVFKKNMEGLAHRENYSNVYLIIFGVISLTGAALWVSIRDGSFGYLLAVLLGGILLWQKLGPRTPWRKKNLQHFMLNAPKVLVDPEKNKAPFIDATGFSEGALFGDVRHDPFQSGGVETPPHRLVEPGAVHKAHGGILYIDEIGTLSQESQRFLLTAIQEKALPITGRHQGSSGTLIATGPVPCDFILVAAGNKEDVSHLLPAFRSRILGFGYEVMTESSLPDHDQTKQLVTQLVAQEVVKDGKIPHFLAEAVDEVYQFAKERSDKPGFVSARWRELGGLIRIAGDFAVSQGELRVRAVHVREAKSYAGHWKNPLAPHQKTSSLGRFDVPSPDGQQKYGPEVTHGR